MLLFSALSFEPLYARYSVARTAQFTGALRRLCWGSLGLGLATGAAWFWVVAHQMSDDPSTALPSWDALRAVGSETQFGRLWALRGVLLLLGAVALFAPRPARGWIALPLAAGLLTSLSWAGHAGAMPGLPGLLHLGADILHLLAAALWPTGLVPLFLLLASCRPTAETQALLETSAAVRRFSGTSLLAIGMMSLTGLVESYFLLGNRTDLVTTGYGRCLLLKLILFAGMLVLGVQNRFSVSSFRVAGQLPATLRRNVMLEIAAGAIILVLVGALGLSAPAAHPMH